MAVFGTNALPLHLLGIVRHGPSRVELRAPHPPRRRAPARAAGGALLPRLRDHSMGVGGIATVTDLLALACS
jgi:hypothetical protein